MRAEVDSGRQLVNHYTAKIIALDPVGSTVKQAPPFVFPAQFSLKRNTPFAFDYLRDYLGESTAEPLLMDASVKAALEYIDKQTPKEGDGINPVPPCAIASVARSGKTTLLQSIFNRLLQDGKFNPIFVNFNGKRGLEQGFHRQHDESDYDAFLRWVAVSLLEETDTAGTCQEQDLEEYLSRSELPIVLLVDELNALTANDISEELARLLRQRFLDQPNRYLCFTSHWFLDLSPLGHSESPRDTNFVELPNVQNEKGGIDVLTEKTGTSRVQVAECLGTVGLLVSSYHERNFKPDRYFAQRTASKTFPLSSFLDEFCKGVPRHDEMRHFDRFTSILENGKIAWPILFAKEFLYSAGEYTLYNLMNHTTTAIERSSYNEDSGDEWEYTVRVAIAMVARNAEFRGLNQTQATILGVPDENIDSRPKLYVRELPGDIKTPQQAQEHLDSYIEKTNEYPTLVLAYPRAQLEIFDTITCFKYSESTDTIFTGQQMKQGEGYPAKDAPSPFNGLLIRGDADYNPRRRPTKRKGWQYISGKEMHDFLPCSLHPLIPSEWLKQKKKKKKKKIKIESCVERTV